VIGNHTFNRWWLTDLTDAQVIAQLEQNEEWIGQTYGITARPWWRPPYGAYDERTSELAASIGCTDVLMWNGSYGDSTPIRPGTILALARQYLHPGVVMLGHANYPDRDRDLPPACGDRGCPRLAPCHSRRDVRNQPRHRTVSMSGSFAGVRRHCPRVLMCRERLLAWGD
jgi:peptidoglycan/xylan/chitin deacetylase (PgdA/CDA1 family)